MSAKNLFSDDPIAHEVFLAVWNKIKSVYADVDLDARECVVAVKDRNRPFCWLWVPAPGNSTYGGCPLVVSFALDSRVQPNRFCRVVQMASDRWMYHCGIEEGLGLCDTMLGLIDIAHTDKVEGRP